MYYKTSSSLELDICTFNLQLVQHAILIILVRKYDLDKWLIFERGVLVTTCIQALKKKLLKFHKRGNYIYRNTPNTHKQSHLHTAHMLNEK